MSVSRGYGCPIQVASSVWSLYPSPVFGCMRTLLKPISAISLDKAERYIRAGTSIHHKPRKECARLVNSEQIHLEHGHRMRAWNRTT